MQGEVVSTTSYRNRTITVTRRRLVDRPRLVGYVDSEQLNRIFNTQQTAVAYAKERIDQGWFNDEEEEADDGDY